MVLCRFPGLLIREALSRLLILSETLTQQAALEPRIVDGEAWGEVLYARLFWVWIFKELGLLHNISEVLGKA